LYNCSIRGLNNIAREQWRALAACGFEWLGTLVHGHPIRKQAVSESLKLNCPECNTPNDVDAPFCENCGFRLKRAPTALEGHAAVSRAHQKRGKIQANTDLERPAIEIESMRSTIPEGVPSVRARRPADADSATFLEGLSPVKIPDDPETIRGHEPIRESAAHASGLNAVPAEERRSSYALIFTGWVVTTGALVLLTYFLANAEPEPILLRADPGPVAIEAGPFVKGLSEQVRAFILMTCTRVSEDRATCDENKLLGGEFPQETVTLPGYSIDSQEVTNTKWQACVKAGKCVAPDYKNCKVYTNQGFQVSMRVPKHLHEDSMPVSCVTREEAQSYCDFAGGALPTEDQWEKAARGTKGNLFPWGDNWDPIAANWGESDVVRTSVVGRIDGHAWASPPSSYESGRSPGGAYDMAGNVAEWVLSAGPEAIARGGSWASSPFDLRTTGRSRLTENVRRADLGFRCVYSD